MMCLSPFSLLWPRFAGVKLGKLFSKGVVVFVGSALSLFRGGSIDGGRMGDVRARIFSFRSSLVDFRLLVGESYLFWTSE